MREKDILFLFEKKINKTKKIKRKNSHALCEHVAVSFKIGERGLDLVDLFVRYCCCRYRFLNKESEFCRQRCRRGRRRGCAMVSLRCEKKAKEKETRQLVAFPSSFSSHLPKRRLDRFLQQPARIWRGRCCVRGRGKRRGGRHKTSDAFVFFSLFVFLSMRSIKKQ